MISAWQSRENKMFKEGGSFPPLFPLCPPCRTVAAASQGNLAPDNRLLNVASSPHRGPSKSTGAKCTNFSPLLGFGFVRALIKALSIFKTTANGNYILPLLTFQEQPETEAKTPSALDLELIAGIS